MPGTAHGVVDHEALGERTVVMRAVGADREKLLRRAGPAAHRPRRHDREAFLRPRHRAVEIHASDQGRSAQAGRPSRIILLVASRFDDDQRYPMPVT